jgi:hypothetical protein
VTNGHAPPTDIEFQLSRLTYGHLKKLRKLQGTPEAEDYFDEILDLVVPGGIDDLPFLEARGVIDRLMKELQGAMSGKAEPVAPSLPV